MTIPKIMWTFKSHLNTYGLWVIYFLKIKQIKCSLIKIKITVQVFKCTPKANPGNDIFFEIAQLPSSKKDGLDSDILLEYLWIVLVFIILINLHYMFNFQNKVTSTQMFSCEICKIFKITFSYRTLTSGGYQYYSLWVLRKHLNSTYSGNM